MKQLFIIPGFGEKTSGAGYKKIRKTAEKKGYEVIPVNLTWSYKVMSDWVNEARTKISKNSDGDMYILGFSFGALVALSLTNEFNFKKVFICSPSTPYFRENLKSLPKSAREWLGKRRLKDFKNFSSPRKVKSMTVFFQGTKEWGMAQKQLSKLLKQLNGPKRVHKLKDVEHNIDNKLYVSAINKEL